jgi:tRNA threonylcarbamoyladenosine biosynthesis protein TsaB
MNSPDQIVSLSVETSGRIGGVALGRGLRMLETADFSAGLRHAVELLPTADSLCRRHGVKPGEIEEVYVSIGPGSFTGIRLGVTFAKTLAIAGGARLVGVATLEAIAQNALALATPPERVAVFLDAKRGHVYAAGFALDRQGEEPIYRAFVPAAEVDPAEFLARMPAGTALLGEGVVYHQDAVRASGGPVLPAQHHRARVHQVFRLGWQAARDGKFDDPIKLAPTYVRRPEAEEVYDRKHPPPP